MQVNCYTFSNGQPASAHQVAAHVSEQTYSPALVHQLVVAYQANARLGTKAQKTRAQVKSGGRKPWKQKGSGRARAGCKTGPIWRGGGATFAANGEQNFSQKMNRKMYRAAIRSILAELIRKERLLIIDDLQLENAKTKSMVESLKRLGLTGTTSLVVHSLNENALLASSNLYWVHYFQVNSLNPVDLIRSDHVVMTKAAFARLEETLKK